MSWPYGDPPEPLLETDTPTWRCPTDTCQCHPIKEGGEEHELSIVLLAHDGARMPGARCRVHFRGRVINEDTPNADGDGRLRLLLPRMPLSLLVEWAPGDTPDDPRYPYRARYFVDLTTDEEQSGRRRLANLGFWTERSLEGNVRSFQRRYHHPEETGQLRDIEAQLTTFHDLGCPPVTHDPAPGEVPSPSFEKGSGKDTSLSLAPSKAKTGDGDKAPPTPQPPVAPAPNQGSVKVPNPAVQVDLIIDWGRGHAGGGGQTSSSFWLNPKAPPVAVGEIDAPPPRWASDPFKQALTIARPTTTTAQTTLPLGPVEIRLDFDLQVTIGSHTRTVLQIQQHFFLFADGELSPWHFAFDDFTYAKGSSLPATPVTPPPSGTQGKRPVRAKGAGKNVSNGKRIGKGLHPLLLTGPDLLPPDPAKKGPKPKNAVPRRTKRLFVNCEMVDATDLFWDLHEQGDAERYLHPGLLGRPEHMRVLAWTTGKLPMIWFAMVPDAALSKVDGGADLVFFRPPPGANSFTHKPDEAAFKDERHHVGKDNKVSTLWMLARFLLPSQSMAALNATVADFDLRWFFCNQIQPRMVKDKSGNLVRAPLTAHLSEFSESFRACGMERFLNAAGAPHVLFFPLASENDGYPGAIRPGLKAIVESAIHCLWTRCAIARDLPTSEIDTTLDGPPEAHPQQVDTAKRQLWLAGHSAGNFSLGAALSANGADVDRALSFAATNFQGIVDNVIVNLGVAARARNAAGKKTIDAFVTTGPDLPKATIPQLPDGSYAGVPTIRAVGMDVAHAKKFLATGASVTFLPAFDAQLTHFTLRPATSMVPVLHNLVGAWTDAEIDDEAGKPSKWQFLFFHEYAVHGGDGTPASPRPFFLQALGAPNPLTTPPKSLPP